MAKTRGSGYEAPKERKTPRKKRGPGSKQYNAKLKKYATNAGSAAKQGKKPSSIAAKKPSAAAPKSMWKKAATKVKKQKAQTPEQLFKQMKLKEAREYEANKYATKVLAQPMAKPKSPPSDWAKGEEYMGSDKAYGSLNDAVNKLTGKKKKLGY